MKKKQAQEHWIELEGINAELNPFCGIVKLEDAKKIYEETHKILTSKVFLFFRRSPGKIFTTAIINCDIKIIYNLLATNKVDPNCRINYSQNLSITPIALATSKGNIEAMKTLLQFGADITQMSIELLRNRELSFSTLSYAKTASTKSILYIVMMENSFASKQPNEAQNNLNLAYTEDSIIVENYLTTMKQESKGFSRSFKKKEIETIQTWYTNFKEPSISASNDSPSIIVNL